MAQVRDKSGKFKGGGFTDSQIVPRTKAEMKKRDAAKEDVNYAIAKDFVDLMPTHLANMQKIDKKTIPEIVGECQKVLIHKLRENLPAYYDIMDKIIRDEKTHPSVRKDIFKMLTQMTGVSNDSLVNITQVNNYDSAFDRAREILAEKVTDEE